MKVQSAKSKGRRLQKSVVKALMETLNGLDEGDIRSTSMGAFGEDILFSPAARKLFPFSIECKNVEKFNVWGAIDQCLVNTPKDCSEMIVFTKNHKKTYVALPFEKFLEIYKVYLDAKKDS